jgi:hypothetical protein
MEVDQAAKGLELADAGNRRGLAAVNLTLGVDGPALGVLVADEVLAGRAALESGAVSWKTSEKICVSRCRMAWPRWAVTT